MKRHTHGKIAYTKFCKWTVTFALVTLLFGAGMWRTDGKVMAQNLPTQVEAMRGNVWNGSECCKWQFSWTHKSGPFFRGEWWNPNGQRLADDNITVNILDNTVEIIRGGGSSSGGCTYKGNIRVGSAEGEYWCAGRYAGKWGALIR